MGNIEQQDEERDPRFTAAQRIAAQSGEGLNIMGEKMQRRQTCGILPAHMNGGPAFPTMTIYPTTSQLDCIDENTV